ncbi:AraC family transcriptional regulator [Fulvivirga sp. M361]|uniref:helix-turn-helix domain-containing protein n=1 Tax=Fulvivirga sp. M361 TaxID=2594266 RepID=UPI00117A7FDB|nr:helix-turn-helix domain-containing protein [Fulvivirga sp. M361]TRX60798.1 AraC family transcriptional regulator [Fulvivirga sp. M361]
MFQSARYIPHITLRPFIRYYQANAIAAQYVSTVLPDFSVVMGFQYGGKLWLADKGEKRLERLCLTGMSGTYRTFQNSADFGIILVYFTPVGASAFFNIPLHEVFQTSIALDTFYLPSEIQATEERLITANSNKERITLIDSFFLNRLKSDKVDNLMSEAALWIQKRNGNVKITDLAFELCMSQSRLEKRFRSAVGCSPKKYATISRMRCITERLTPCTDLQTLTFDHGYYDQAHFNRDFKHFTGQSPKHYISTVKKD